MKTKFILSAAVLAVSLCSLTPPGNIAQAQQENGSLYYYQIPAEDIRNNPAAWRLFTEYNLSREPCQHYQDPPAPYIMRGCHIYRIEPAAPSAAAVQMTTAVPAPAPASVPMSYTIYFGVDKARVPANETALVSDVVQEIRRDNPSAVSVSGYASTTGTAEHNQRLSEERARNVAAGLLAGGVSPDVITQQGFGETHLAVPTPDNVELQANRRVTVEFNR